MTTTNTTRHADDCRFLTAPLPWGPPAPDPVCPRCAARLAAMGWPARDAAPMFDAWMDRQS